MQFSKILLKKLSKLFTLNELKKLVADKQAQTYIKNPLTSRQIKVNGPTYKKIIKQGYELNNGVLKKSFKQLIAEYKEEDERSKQQITQEDGLMKKLRNGVLEKSFKQLIAEHKDLDIKSKEQTKQEDDLIKKLGKILQTDKKKAVPTITPVKSALKGSITSYVVPIVDDKDPMIQLNNTRSVIKKQLSHDLEDMKGIKYYETLKITFLKPQDGGKFLFKTAYFNSKAQAIINMEDENNQVAFNQIMNAIGNWMREGSGWLIDSVNKHFVNINKYKPLNGSSYIKLPVELQNAKKGIINMKNEDNECFRWCHLRYLHPTTSHPERISKKLKIKDVNYAGVEFPVSLKHYHKIEKQNSISINVFGYVDKQPYPIYISKEKNDNHMDLLLISKKEKQHYCLIKDFNRFMYNQTKHEHKKQFCRYCLQCFSTDVVLKSHTPNCIAVNGVQAVKMPKSDKNMLKYTNFHKQLDVPFVIYADFEAITEKVTTTTNDPAKSYTNKYQKHTDCGFGYKLVCCYDDKYSKPVETYRGPNAVHSFMKKMLEEVKSIKKIRKEHFNKDMIMTKLDIASFKLAKKCHICDELYKSNDIGVRDHCHVTGKYRGSAHESCNLSFRLTDKIPVIFHNLRGYDSHFIMQEIGKFNMDINVIPNNMEKYMAFMLGKHLVFLDSFQFMSSSLDRLASNLTNESFKYTSEEFKNNRQLKLMKQKGTYPYDYMDSFDRFQDTRLPSKKDFYSILSGEHITDKTYQHALNVWKTFKLKTMGEYHDLYLKTDVLLLADVFENFRKVCNEYYKLDPCHYFTSPGLSWDAMLKMTKIKLQLITDIDIFQFIEKGMRGGISCITNRHGTANNKYMKDYDENKPTKYISYLDANNLYGWAMSQYLPTGGHKWLKPDNVDLSKYKDDSKKGIILEVDLEYPKEFHDKHNDYPLAPEALNITDDMLSPYANDIKNLYNIHSGGVKLAPNLMNKMKYVVHYRNLQLYTDLGMKITKVHRVLEFDQSPWLKLYINFNTDKRKAAKNKFEKDFFKLMNNSVFGKTMENLRKRVDIRLVTSEKKLLKWVAKPSFVSSKIFNNNLVAIHKIKETLVLNRPVYVGQAILDISKTLMYDFHYNYILKKYDNVKLLATDTDSLMYEIETDDIYKDFFNDKHLFDNSDYQESSPYYFSNNEKVIGKFKDEAAGIPITEFVGLRSKMYSYTKDNSTGGKTAKGIKKNVIKQQLRHENYVDTLFNKRQMIHKMNTIRSFGHQIGSYEINKISLSCFDDKRYLHDDGITSYAYGHYKI